MPPRVPRNTTQSATFTRRSGRTPRAGSPRGQTTRTRTDTRFATHGTQAGRTARRQIADQAAVVRAFTQGDEIGKQPTLARHSLRKLAKAPKAGIDEKPL